MRQHITATTRQELVSALRVRYQSGAREEKSRILEEFVALSGYHRKSAIRILNSPTEPRWPESRASRCRVYDEAVRQVLIVLWEASDRICGKRLKALIPVLVPALERHGHLQLDPGLRDKLTAISASSIDRLLRQAHATNPRRRPRRASTPLRRSVPIRTFADWNEPAPGYMEMDLVAHCGETMGGSCVYTLSATDVATGWTECIPLLVREASLVVEAVQALRGSMPFLLRGLDIDNGSEFLNETLVRHCAAHGIEFTRSRPYHKNDQAWIEQKNGSVVRRLVGYRRLEGVAAAEALSRLYAAARLFVNFFQPSFKLKEKVRTGARVIKRYHTPETPCARLLNSEAISGEVKKRMEDIAETLDPLALLDEIRATQHQLALLADGKRVSTPARPSDDLTRFLTSLSSAWHEGEVRPTHRQPPKPARYWRTRKDPFESVWPTILQWLDREPDLIGKAILERLQREYPGIYPDGQLRTLQRRLKQWRGQMARRLVFGVQAWEGGTHPHLPIERVGNIVDEAAR
ncbi:MAG: ISNCY family transposase [Salinisphaera sp.]|nr:ISNCY family transposase [Salinisphaera sp.]